MCYVTSIPFGMLIISKVIINMAICLSLILPNNGNCINKFGLYVAAAIIIANTEADAPKAKEDK